uniref:Uncharacterized protein n=1 Tax=Setaria italica TaxID=4555 RepID=K3ZBP4_SETIT
MHLFRFSQSMCVTRKCKQSLNEQSYLADRKHPCQCLQISVGVTSAKEGTNMPNILLQY